MRIFRTSTPILLVAMCGLGWSMGGCEKKTEPPPSAPAKPSVGDGHDHTPGDGQDHADSHGHGPAQELGSQSVAGMIIAATQEGDVVAGGMGTFDVTITGSAGKPAAVRMWLGAQDAKGSLKAKAEEEGSGWHAHVEVAKPIAAGSRLWVEVEAADGQKHVVGFDYKP